MASPWSTACPDWEELLLGGRPLVPDFLLLGEDPFREEAERALRVFKRLRLPDVIGTPTMGDAAGEWFFAIVAALFGSYDPRVNTRMIQEVFLLVPKKNSKSSGAGMLMLTAVIVNRRPEGEFSLIAPTKEIADISFRQISGAIRLDEALATLFHAQRHIRLITHRKTGATLQIKAADEDVITGGKAVGTLVDETHVFANKPRAGAIFLELRGALAARPDGFMVQITTQSKDPPAGVFRSELHAARDVRDGNLDLPLLPVLYELPEEIAKSGAWKERRYWPLVNPNLGRSVDEDFLTRELMKAEREGPHQLALLASQHFNIEIGIGLRTDRWPGAEFWEQQGDPALTRDALLARSEVVVAGVDGGGLDDLFGLVLLGRDRETKHWLCWAHAWCHAGVLTRRQSIASNLRDFEAAGDLTILDDKLGHIEQAVEIVLEVRDAGMLSCVAIDDEGPFADFVYALDDVGVTDGAGQIVGVRQGYKLMSAIKTAELKLANGTLHHSGSGLMAWCTGNVKIEATATAIRATKQNAGDAKIDPWMALMDAAYVMQTNPQPALDVLAMIA